MRARKIAYQRWERGRLPTCFWSCFFTIWLESKWADSPFMASYWAYILTCSVAISEQRKAWRRLSYRYTSSSNMQAFSCCRDVMLQWLHKCNTAYDFLGKLGWGHQGIDKYQLLQVHAGVWQQKTSVLLDRSQIWWRNTSAKMGDLGDQPTDKLKKKQTYIVWLVHEIHCLQYI